VKRRMNERSGKLESLYQAALIETR